MTMLAGGKWIDCEERNPEQYGKYRVICLKRGQRTEDDYLWNGGYWVTPGGSPSKGVQSWWEQAAPADNSEKPQTALQAGAAGRVLTLADYEARIHLYKEQIGTGYIGIGRTLLEAKEAKVVPHGQWETWVTETTGLTARQAQRCMQAATEIRDGSAMARLEMSKALMLLGSGLDEEAREEIAEKAADEGATVKALREEIRQAKLKLVQETGAAMEIRDALRKAEEERGHLEQQLRARESAYKAQLEEARESGYQRGNLDGQADALQQAREEARGQILELKRELDVSKSRLDEAIRDNRALKAEENEKERARAAAYGEGKKDAAAEAEQQIIGLRNELNKQNQYVESLREELARQKDAAVPADFARDREILMEAAAEAEQRAANAEAELEALKACGAGQPDPAWKVLKKALDIFMSDCELLPINDVHGLLREEKKVLRTLDFMEAWIKATREAMASAVEAEGAVE